jgi:tetratricopeptide (TPR) repeat protein
VFRQQILVAVFACVCNYCTAQSFDFNNNCRQAYNSIIALKIDAGEGILKAEEKANPDNMIPVYLENYVDFLRIYTSERRDLYDQLKKNKDLRLALLNSADQQTPYYLFTQAEVNLQWAALHIRFGDYLNAIVSIRRAFKMLEANESKYPGFMAGKKSLGVLYALLGSVPDKYRWGVNMLGMEGSIEKGMGYLSQLVEYGKTNDYIYNEETITYYVFLMMHLQNENAKAWQILQQYGFPKKDNLMNVYTCAHIGIYGKYTTQALALLQNRPLSDSFAVFPMLDYLQGLGKLGRLDTDAASYFKKFLAGYKGEDHIRSAYQKIAWCYLLQGDTLNYLHFIDKAGKLGATTLDADKQAKKEADSKHIPAVGLLRARVLFDGGYYKQAADEMMHTNTTDFKTADEKTEYLYRMARIYDEWNKPDTALNWYKQTIDTGKNLPRYFAANAALQAGRIYETRGESEKAKQYYNLCLSFTEHEYKNGLDQKAKAGLNRLK